MARAIRKVDGESLVTNPDGYKKAQHKSAKDLCG